MVPAAPDPKITIFLMVLPSCVRVKGWLSVHRFRVHNLTFGSSAFPVPDSKLLFIILATEKNPRILFGRSGDFL
jgi:hypothetical protein